MGDQGFDSQCATKSHSTNKLYNLPWEAAITGTGAAVENMKERPLDCISCFHFCYSCKSLEGNKIKI